jgi:hypothetical protein
MTKGKHQIFIYFCHALWHYGHDSCHDSCHRPRPFFWEVPNESMTNETVTTGTTASVHDIPHEAGLVIFPWVVTWYPLVN